MALSKAEKIKKKELGYGKPVEVFDLIWVWILKDC